MTDNSGRPLLYAVVDVIAPEQALDWTDVALSAGMDGVFLISHARDDGTLSACIRGVRTAFPSAFLGANVIGRSPADSLEVLGEFGLVALVDALWTDSAGRDPSDARARGDAFARVRSALGWQGLHFGGVAFKYQPEVASSELSALTIAAARHVDVVTTSGAGTGQAIDVDKLRTMRAALDSHPLALASGVTAENAADVRDTIQHVLVSTGIKGPDGRFDPVRIAGLRGVTS